MQKRPKLDRSIPMNSIIPIVVLLALNTSLLADENWLTNLEEAKKKAKSEKKLILLNFTGSDWCLPCVALKKKVFEGQEFKKYAPKNLVLLEVDFPRKAGKISKEQLEYNKELAKKFRVTQYPTVVVASASGQELHRELGFNGDSKAYLTRLKDAKFQ